MGRKLKTRLPILETKLKPLNIDHDKYRKWDTNYRNKQAVYYNKRHRVNNEKPLSIGQHVFIPDKSKEGVVKTQVAPRSYIVETQNGCLRRNHAMMRPLSEGRENEEITAVPETCDNQCSPEVDSDETLIVQPTNDRTPQSRYGRKYKTVKRLDL